jgi:hypothetical protein
VLLVRPARFSASVQNVIAVLNNGDGTYNWIFDSAATVDGTGVNGVLLHSDTDGWNPVQSSFAIQIDPVTIQFVDANADTDVDLWQITAPATGWLQAAEVPDQEGVVE